jgi:putative membrane protein
MVNLNEACPVWAKKLFTEKNLETIHQLVRRIEEKTECEIVPIVVKRSCSVGHVPVLVMAVLLISALAIERVFLNHYWALWPVWYYLPVSVFIVLISLWFSRFDFVQRFFTPDPDEIAQVLRRAELEFHRSPVHQTRHGTGVLIFASLMERRAVVLADKGIAQLVPQELWDEVSRLLSSEFKEKRFTLGFERAIVRCGEILQTHLPAKNKNTNEVSNHLVILD